MVPRIRSSFLGALAITTLPLVLVLITVTLIWSEREHQATEAQAFAEIRALTSALESMISESRRVLETISLDSSRNWGDLSGVARSLTLYQNHFPFSYGVFLFDPDGNLVTAPDQTPVNVSDRSWFRQAKENRGLTVGEFILSRLSGIPSLPLAMPVTREGRILGVVGMSIDLEWFYSKVAALQGLERSTLTIVGKDATVLVRYPEPGRFVGTKFPQEAVLREALAGRESATVFSGLDGVKRLYSVEPLRPGTEVAGLITLGVPVADIERQTQLAQWGVGGSLLVAVLVALGLSAFGTQRFLLNPLLVLSAQTQRLALGELSARTVSQRMPRELADLAHSINTMADSLESRDREIARHREHLEDLVAERTADLELSRAELQRSNEELQQFAYVASHDLQEPLRMVASFTQLLEKKYAAGLDDQAREYIRFAVDGATRMQRLINDLLAYSRVETQGHNLVAIDATGPALLTVQNLALLIQEKEALVQVNPLPTVMANPGQLAQVFQNLIGNALKFNRSSPPRVEVSGETKGNLVEIRVEDNGIGIEPEFRERVFVIFQRLHSRAEFSGTGIGLAVCRRIVEKHGGTIVHQPAAGGGSCFVFTLKAPKKGQKEGQTEGQKEGK